MCDVQQGRPARHSHEFKLTSINPDRLWYNGEDQEDVHMADYRVGVTHNSARSRP